MVKPWRVNRQRGVPASHRHGFMAHLREYLLPTMGLRAFGRWAMLKLLRQAHRPHYVALGTAMGVIVSFFPIPGTHTIILILLCAIFRGSIISAVLSSNILANPWTIVPMWVASFHYGRRLLGMPPGSEHAIERLGRISWLGLWQQLQVKVEYVIIPTIVGGWVIGVPLAIAIYILIYYWLRRRIYRLKRVKRFKGGVA